MPIELPVTTTVSKRLLLRVPISLFLRVPMTTTVPIRLPVRVPITGSLLSVLSGLGVTRLNAPM